jgi:hypothetical protein
MTEYEQNIEIMKDLRGRIDAVLATQPNSDIKIPDPAKHFRLSMYKSAVRIAAGVAFCTSGSYYIVVGGVALIIAEIVGILEEMV